MKCGTAASGTHVPSTRSTDDTMSLLYTPDVYLRCRWHSHCIIFTAAIQIYQITPYYDRYVLQQQKWCKVTMKLQTSKHHRISFTQIMTFNAEKVQHQTPSNAWIILHALPSLVEPELRLTPRSSFTQCFRIQGCR